MKRLKGALLGFGHQFSLPPVKLLCLDFACTAVIAVHFFLLRAQDNSSGPDSWPLALTARFLLQTHSILPYPRSGLLPPLPRGPLSSGFCYLTLFYYHETSGCIHVLGQWRFSTCWSEGCMRSYRRGWVNEASLSEVGFQSGWTT